MHSTTQWRFGPFKSRLAGIRALARRSGRAGDAQGVHVAGHLARPPGQAVHQGRSVQHRLGRQRGQRRGAVACDPRTAGGPGGRRRRAALHRHRAWPGVSLRGAGHRRAARRTRRRVVAATRPVPGRARDRTRTARAGVGAGPAPANARWCSSPARPASARPRWCRPLPTAMPALATCGWRRAAASSSTARQRPTCRSWRRWSNWPGRSATRPCALTLSRYAPAWLALLPWLAQGAEPAAATRGGDDVTAQRMLREIAQALEVLAARSPIVLWLEDLHWSDPSSLAVLSFLAGRRGPARLLLVGSFRPADAQAGDSPLHDLALRLTQRGQAVDLALGLLDRPAVAQYLKGRFGDDADAAGTGADRRTRRLRPPPHRRQPAVHGGDGR